VKPPKVKLAKLYKIEGLPKKRKPRPQGSQGDFALPQERASQLELEVNKIQRQIHGTYAEARRVRSLQDKFPQGTVPELVAYDWLKRNEVPFDYQVELQGGRSNRGGLVPDFVVREGGKGIAWLVQGDYYHSPEFQARHGQQNRDLHAGLRLRGLVYNGVRIETVVPLWENDIYTRRPEIFVFAASGEALYSV
jgi:hypothetical protein